MHRRKTPHRPEIGLKLAIAALLLVCAGSGCGTSDRLRNVLRGGPDDTAAVSVGNRQYGRAELDRFFDNRLSEFRDPADADRVKSNLLETFIEEKVLLGRAEQLKIEADADSVRAMLARISEPSEERAAGKRRPGGNPELERSISENLKIQRYLHDYLLKDLAVTEQECEKYYHQHLAEYVRNDVVRLREILVENQAEAQKIQGLLSARRNKNFGELARVYSRAPSADSGGELGTFQRGDLPAEFEKVVFSLTPGTASRIVRTKYGYHIFLVEERISAHQLKFWEVKDEIRDKLLLDREREMIDRELASLIEQTPVEIHKDRLDFKYIGTRFPPR